MEKFVDHIQHVKHLFPHGDHSGIIWCIKPAYFYLFIYSFTLQSALDSSPRNPSPIVQNGEKGELAFPRLYPLLFVNIIRF